MRSSAPGIAVCIVSALLLAFAFIGGGAIAAGDKPASAVTSLVVDAAWLRLPPMASRPAGGYLEIKGGADDDRLVRVAGALAQRIEIHSMSMNNGVMRMDRVDGLAVPAGQTVQLAPGGYHLMLFGLTDLPEPGSRVDLTLTFEKAGDVVVPFEIRNLRGNAAGKTPAKPAGHSSH